MKKSNVVSKKTDNTESEEQSKMYANLFTNPTLLTTHMLARLWEGHTIESKDMLDKLSSINSKIMENNDTEYLELLLLNQAHMLNGMFMKLSAMGLKSEYVKNTSVFAQLALNAQKQARATITALANLKNPKPATFIKQQNNAVNQQVNNAPEERILKNSEKTLSNELLSEVPHEKLDTRSKSHAGNPYSPVATLAESRR